MSGVTLKVITNAIQKMHQNLLKQTANLKLGFEREVLPVYANLQRKRWMSEGASESERWEPLDRSYAKRKLTRFASYPGGGRKMLIAKGRLVSAVTLEKKRDYETRIKDKSIEILIKVPYAIYVNETRDFTTFSDKSRKTIVDSVKKFLLNGVTTRTA